MRYVSVLVAAIAVAAAPANAVVFNFSTSFDQGPNQGVLSGTINLSSIASGGSGTAAADVLTLTATPAGIPLPQGPVATSWSVQWANSFTVTAGAITAFQFFALDQDNSAGVELCLNSGGGLSSVGRLCPGGLNFLGTGGSTQYGYNFGGFGAVAFTEQNAVPEPASWALMIAGFGLIGAAMRRRAALVRFA